LIEATPDVVTWIKVQKPALDLAAVILGSIAISALLALLACLLGALGGIGLIRRHAKSADEPGSHLTCLDLSSPPDPPKHA
jgi:hypothetical protein